MEDFENNFKKDADDFEKNISDENTGYTVTPEGGFYSRGRDDIIQDGDIKSYSSGVSGYTDYSNYSGNSFSQRNYSAYNQPNNSATYKGTKRKKKYSSGIVILASVMAAVIGAVSGVTAMTYLREKSSQPIQEINDPAVPQQNVNINIDETAESVVEAVAKKVTPSVVGIRTTTSVMSFFGETGKSTGEGSGVVYSSDGYIITNYHVIGGAVSNKNGSKIEVFTKGLNDKSYEASVVGYNIASDIAVIKINVSGLTPIEIANSDNLKVGQYVITVGNPGGLEFMDSVTYGVISGLNRVVSSSSDVELIQTDAAINPGNSGGALVNAKGQLVGINSSKIVSEEFEGMGFAIPSNTVVKLCDNIISKENEPEPYFGVTVSEKYTASVLNYYGYPEGAVVSSVADDSPAYNAGIQRGDIITEFNGTKIKEYTMLEDLLKDCKPGQKVNVKVYRSKRYYTANVKLEANNAVN